ncbi:VOC family protein [Sphingobium sp.]|uniref:VOC family protein n=1 Tax=Sphingobium sp. TaxID=1912891 RepID=UPI002D13CB7E|nr:VOC family protein [Sphingobium sp.]HUD94485.1 VOC family protein [Sphingobium sp.]
MHGKPVGRLNQIAYMVPDLDAAIDWWTQVMGIGPFFVFAGFDMVQSDYRGVDQPIAFGAAVSFSGDLMVELIEPRGPSIFQEFLSAGRTGVHHLCAFADDMAETQAWVESVGGRRLQGAAFGDGSQIAYFAMIPDESIILEVGVLTPDVLGLFDAIKHAAARWDGKSRLFDPVAAEGGDSLDNMH